MTPEEAQATGKANQMIENNLSSVKIMHNSKGTTWEIKVKHEIPDAALRVAKAIDDDLRARYGFLNGIQSPNNLTDNAQCQYRKTERACGLDKPIRAYTYCQCCLKGQIADEISLNTSAVMNLSMNRMEDEANGKTE